MRKIFLCGAHYCTPCKFIRTHMLKDIEEVCHGQTEYIDLQQTTGAISKFQVYQIPMMCVMDGEEIIARYSGKYPSKECLIAWLRGERNDLDTELFEPH